MQIFPLKFSLVNSNVAAAKKLDFPFMCVISDTEATGKILPTERQLTMLVTFQKFILCPDLFEI